MRSKEVKYRPIVPYVIALAWKNDVRNVGDHPGDVASEIPNALTGNFDSRR